MLTGPYRGIGGHPPSARCPPAREIVAIADNCLRPERPQVHLLRTPAPPVIQSIFIARQQKGGSAVTHPKRTAKLMLCLFDRQLTATERKKWRKKQPMRLPF